VRGGNINVNEESNDSLALDENSVFLFEDFGISEIV
jgi:hypothetical protein